MFRCTKNTSDIGFMATVTGNRDFKTSGSGRLPESECIPWVAVLITECLAIVILNIITIIVFVKQHQLQRRSTYLIIHLAVVDTLVGGVSGPLNLAERVPLFCDLWELPFNRLQSVGVINNPIVLLFYLISIMNLAVISLERLHATFCPFTHRFLKKWVYGVTVGVIWVFSIFVESVPFMSYESITSNASSVSLYYIIRSSFCLLVLVVICTPYILIYIKVRFGAPLQHHGVANREKQLTMTLLVVTLASLLTWLPSVVLFFLVYSYQRYWERITLRSTLHISNAFGVLTLANSLVNPIMYTIRIPAFRTIVCKLFRRPSGRIEIPDIPLNPRNQ